MRRRSGENTSRTMNRRNQGFSRALGSVRKHKHTTVTPSSRASIGMTESVADFLDREQPGWRNQSMGPDYRPAWLNDTTNTLARELTSGISAAADVIRPLAAHATGAAPA